MSFWIQTGSPALLDVDGVADNMADAITMLYPVDTDLLIVSWNLVPIALTYCEDVQVMVDDIVVLLEQLANPATNAAHVHWGSSTFRSEWWVRREGEKLVVDARWDSTAGNYEPLLNERGRLTVETTVFTREWLKVLRRLVADIAAKSVALDNPDMLLRARALLAAAQSPGAESGAVAPTGPGRSGDVRFQAAPAGSADTAASADAADSAGTADVADAADSADAPVLWQVEAAVARLFAGEAALVAALLGVPSGVGEVTADRCALDLPAFSAFCATAVAQYATTNQAVQRALTVGFIATALVLLDRAGHSLPSAPSPEQQAAWAALRDQHAAVMPR